CRCCEIGCRERLPLEFPSREPSPVLYAAPVVKNPPRKDKGPVTAEVCTL
ncbi:Hypothetical protein FKW44_019498, partial [Caligus rogercresseyi]